MNYIDSLQYPRDGQIVIMFWNNHTVSVHEWRFGKIDWTANVVPFGWVENTDENYWMYVGDKEGSEGKNEQKES